MNANGASGEALVRLVSRILGIALPLASGLATVWLMESLALGTGLSLGLLAALGAVSALLIRSWWTLAVTPASYLVGWLGGLVIHASLPGRAWEPGTEVLAVGIFALYMLPPLLVGAALGQALMTVLTAAARE